MKGFHVLDVSQNNYSLANTICSRSFTIINGWCSLIQSSSVCRDQTCIIILLLSSHYKQWYLTNREPTSFSHTCDFWVLVFHKYLPGLHLTMCDQWPWCSFPHLRCSSKAANSSTACLELADVWPVAAHVWVSLVQLFM